MRSVCSAAWGPETAPPQRGQLVAPVAIVLPHRVHAAGSPAGVVTAAGEASRGLLGLPVTGLHTTKSPTQCGALFARTCVDWSCSWDS